MFELVNLEDVVRVPPDKFGSPLEKVALDLLKLKYESTINPDHGYLVLVTKVEVDKVGKIIAGDGATYHRVRFEVLSFFPLKQEIVVFLIVFLCDLKAFDKCITHLLISICYILYVDIFPVGFHFTFGQGLALVFLDEGEYIFPVDLVFSGFHF